MEHFYNLPHMGEDWFTYPKLYKTMVETFPTGSKFVEIGVWKGKSAAFLAVEIINSGKNITVDGIDTFGGSPEHDGMDVIVNNKLYEICSNNLKPVSHVINLIKCDSVSAAPRYEDKSLDFVFIDGLHTYEGVYADIEAYLPKVKDGGIICGHDYGWPGEPDPWAVRRAVEDYFRPLVADVSFGCFADPWGAGCWILQIDENGNPKKYSLPPSNPSNLTFTYQG